MRTKILKAVVKMMMPSVTTRVKVAVVCSSFQLLYVRIMAFCYWSKFVSYLVSLKTPFGETPPSLVYNESSGQGDDAFSHHTSRGGLCRLRFTACLPQ